MDYRDSMTINIKEILERAFEQSFLRDLDQIVQTKAEELFEKMLSADSPLAKKLEEIIEEGFLTLSRRTNRSRDRKGAVKATAPLRSRLRFN
jgi:hypothetical protein